MDKKALFVVELVVAIAAMGAAAWFAQHRAPSVTMVATTLPSIDLGIEAPPAAPPKAPPINPMAWSIPQTLPPLRVKLSTADYAKRSETVLATIDKQQLAQPGPLCGAVVTSVEPEGLAHDSGWEVGDVVTRANFKTGSAAIPPDSNFFFDRNNPAVTVERWSGNQKAFVTDSYTGGSFGARLMGFRDVPRCYMLAEDQRGGAWDQDVLVAAKTWDTDTDLAEAALLHAQRAGCNGWIVPMIASLIAGRQGRFEAALDFGTIALRDMPAELAPIITDTVYGAANAAYKLETAISLGEKYFPNPTAANARKRMASLLETRRGPLSAIRPFPMDRQEVADGVDRTDDIKPIDRPGEQMSLRAMQRWKKNHEISFGVQSGKYVLYQFGPGMKNLDFEVTFTSAATDKGENTFFPAFVVGLLDTKVKEFNMPAKFQLDTVGRFHFRTAAGENQWLPMTRAPWLLDRPAVARLILHGDDIQFLVNGKTLYYGPAPAPAEGRSYYVCIQCVGSTGKITEMSLNEPVSH